VDESEAKIIAELRAIGGTVQSLAAVGGGCPDLLVGYRGATLLLEVKTPGIGRVRPSQSEWLARWRGGVARVVTNPREAMRAVSDAVVAAGGVGPLLGVVGGGDRPA